MGQMRTFRYDKLVRDNILPDIEEEGSIVVWRTLDDEEFAEQMAKKLEEELDELDEEVGQNRERDLKELADVAEIYEIAFEILDQGEHYDLLKSAMEELEKGIDMWEIDPDELLEAKAEKIAKMGAFKKRTFIEKVSVEEDNPWIQRYLKSPEKYPEVKA